MAANETRRMIDQELIGRMIRDHGLEQCLQWLYDYAQDRSCLVSIQTEDQAMAWAHDAQMIDRAINKLSTVHYHE